MNLEKITQPGQVAVVGVPFDKNESFLQGPALAPQRIRETLHNTAANLWTEKLVDLGSSTGWVDVGDVVLSGKMVHDVETAVTQLLAKQAKPLTLGGDHSITYPIIKAMARRYPNLTILQIDAHPDLYDELDGSRTSHACPFARIMENNLAARLVQIGIRTLNAHQKAQAERFHVEIIPMTEWSLDKVPTLAPPLYLTLDLDGIDPAFAPGVSHHEPGGFTTRQVLDLIHALPPLVGADIVEFNPHRDPVGITAALAAKLLKELIGHMLPA